MKSPARRVLLVALLFVGPARALAQSPAQPPPPAVAAVAKTRAEEDGARRREAFRIVWEAVRDYHFDPQYGGVDWEAMRREFAPRAEAARTDTELHWLLQQMLNRLGKSHFAVVPPESIPALPEEEDGAEGAGEGAEADDRGPGAKRKSPTAEGLELTERLTHGVQIDLRVVNGAALLTRVEPGSQAARAGLRAGHVIRSVDGVSMRRIIRELELAAYFQPSVRVEMPAEILLEYFNGGPGTTLRLSYLDGRNVVRRAVVRRERLKGEMAQPVQSFPAQFVEFESKRLRGGVGYLRFNVFAAPVLDKFCAALGEMADAPGLVVDLRGNGGGVLALIYGMGGLLSTREAVFGEMRTRGGGTLFRITPQRRAYKGPVAVLVDSTTASASEVLASGLQESGRAVVVGERSAGSALPSVAKELPTGAVLQYAFADFVTPYGRVLEGEGVKPDITVKLDRRSLLAGRDPQLEAALDAVQGANVTAPTYAQVDLPGAGGEDGEAEEPAKADGPAEIEPEVERIVGKYLQAVGGRAALERLTSRVSKGTFQGSFNGVDSSGTIELVEKATGQSVIDFEVPGALTMRRGYTGAYGYEQVSLYGFRRIRGAELEALKSSSDFGWNLNLERHYRKMTLKGKEQVGDGEAYVVEATPARGAPTRLYFAADTGLLLRRDGVNFEDYREVDGIKFPFVQRSEGVVVTIKEVRHNVEVDDARFAERKDCFTR